MKHITKEKVWWSWLKEVLLLPLMWTKIHKYLFTSIVSLLVSDSITYVVDSRHKVHGCTKKAIRNKLPHHNSFWKGWLAWSKVIKQFNFVSQTICAPEKNCTTSQPKFSWLLYNKKLIGLFLKSTYTAKFSWQTTHP